MLESMTAARNVINALGLDEANLPAVHGWTAYVEDRAVQWSGTPKAKRAELATEVDHCARALHALLDLAPS